MPFGDHLHRAVMQALKAIPAADAPGIYALSFFIYDEDDEPPPSAPSGSKPPRVCTGTPK